MSLPARASEEAYREALARYLTHGEAAGLERAAQLGRAAQAEGRSLGELLDAHGAALAVLPGAQEGGGTRAASFLGSTLKAYEELHQNALTAWRHINESLEAEIRRVAHALHDESGQLLVSLHLQLARLARDVPEAQARLQECQQLLHQAEQQLRHLSHDLRPMVLDDLGWLAAIEFLAQAVSARARIPIEVRSSVTQRLAPALETALYRVVQEALANAAHHSLARRIRVELEQDQNDLCGLISDDGVGFETAADENVPGRLGLTGMRERLGAFGGTLRIVSAPGRGAEIRFRLPLVS
jgi:signal transduction histidine kinase